MDCTFIHSLFFSPSIEIFLSFIASHPSFHFIHYLHILEWLNFHFNIKMDYWTGNGGKTYFHTRYSSLSNHTDKTYHQISDPAGESITNFPNIPFCIIIIVIINSSSSKIIIIIIILWWIMLCQQSKVQLRLSQTTKPSSFPPIIPPPPSPHYFVAVSCAASAIPKNFCTLPFPSKY